MTDRMLPDGTTEHRNYDSAGQILTRADFAGKVTQYTYDPSGRVLTRKYPDNSLVTFTYDAAGQRKTATDARGLTTYNYDNRGHVSSLIYPDNRELDYTYDPRGMRSGITAKIGTRTLTTTTGYDDSGRLTTLTDPLNRAYGAQYDANGNRTSLSYPNTQGTTYTYDTRGRLTGLVTKEPGSNGNIAQSYAYTLDLAGKRTRIEESDGTVRQYGYDSVDRLISEAVSGPTNYSNAFGYDPVGNRLTQTSTGNHPGTVNYSYDNRDQLSLENGTAYSYDNNGNLTAKTGEATYTWDFENRLKRVSLQDGTLVDHLYDADGNRVQTKITPTGGGTATTTNFLVDTTGNLSQVVAESDGTGALTAVYVRAYDELLAVLRPTGTSTWATRCVHADGLGSVRVLTDETGTVTDTRGYEAFGTRNVTAGTDPLAFGFAGEAFEARSQLAYHRARWMDPRSGRFLGMDPKEAILQQPGRFHFYIYASGNPIANVDPGGQEFTMTSVGATVAIMANFATMAYGGYRIASGEVTPTLKEIRQTASDDLLALALRIYPPATIGVEAVILNNAVGIIKATKAKHSNNTDSAYKNTSLAFDDLSSQRNSSYESSQNLAIAAAEHFFGVKQEAMRDPGWATSFLGMGAVMGYDGYKAVFLPLAIGFGRYAHASSSYPTTRATVASLVCGAWAIFDAIADTGPTR